MKNVIFLFLFFYSFLISAQDNCKYSVVVNSENLKETGKFKLFFKNTGVHSYNIPKEITFCNMRLENLELFDEETQHFEKIKLANKDIDCFKYEKPKKLKPNKLFIYEINFKNDLQVIEYEGFFEKFNARKYRFKFSFYFEGNQNCEKYNSYTTDWIYKN